MEVNFKPATEAQLKQLAASKGKDAAQLVEEAISGMLERQTLFLAGVDQGIAAADRGELVEHAEVMTRIKGLFPS